MTHGAVAYPYVAEVCVDVASGLVMGLMYVSLTFSMLTFELKIESSLDIHGTIWFYAAITFIGFIFCLFFVRESLGLSDLEKKTLYSPVVRVAPSSASREMTSVPELPRKAEKVQNRGFLSKTACERSHSEQQHSPTERKLCQ